MTSKDTEVKTDAGAVEAWLRAEKAEVPSSAMKERAIRDLPTLDGVAMRYHSLEEAGWVYVYHQRTGDRSIINRNMLQMQLRKKLEDGSLAFSIYPPKDKDGNVIKPPRGTIKCLLHEDRAEREYYDRIGFPICTREGIPSQHALRQHMDKKHKVEWAQIKGDEEELKKKEDRELQRAILNQFVKPKEVTNVAKEETFKCEGCEKVFTSRIALEGHKRSHTK